jgi:hypothetical protein
MTNIPRGERAATPEQPFDAIPASFGEAVDMTRAQQELYYMDAFEEYGTRPVDGRTVRVVSDQPHVILDVVDAGKFIDLAPTASEYFGIVPGAHQFFDVTFAEECFVGDKENSVYTPPCVYINLRDGRNAEYTNYAEYTIVGKNHESGEPASGEVKVDKEYSKKVDYDVVDAAEGEIRNKQTATEHFALQALEKQLKPSDEASDDTLPTEINPDYHKAKEEWLIGEYFRAYKADGKEIGSRGQMALLELSQKFAAVYQEVINENRPR